ncbi:MAG TPA: Gfo/Idh/MocA family oxidoreductase [Acidimicrobiales bacterium]|nr:Gfo/Idh/MocA family oxidoreductase [Acidimicrobiales bacterium]
MIVGVLGLGRIGATHAANLADLQGVEIVAFDPDPAAAERTVSTTGARALPDRDAVLGEADAVVIATPTANHPDDLAAVATAGLPMLCEKPISLDLASTATALEVVARAGVEVQIGFMRRFDAGFVEMRRLVESGDLGDVYLVRAASHDHVPPHESYLDQSGSVFRDMHIHDFDAVRWLTGRDVVEVYAAGSVLVDEMFRRHGDVDMSALVLVLEGGVLASITGARANPLGYDHRTEVIGSHDAVCAGWNERTPLRSVDLDGGRPPIAPYPAFSERFGPAYRAEVEAFVALVRGEGENRSPGHAALEALRVAVAADRSLAEHRPVAVAEITP